MKTKLNPKDRALVGLGLPEYSKIKTILGYLLLVADNTALIGLYFCGHDHVPASSRHWQRNDSHPVLQKAARQVQEYLAGKRSSFSVPLRLAGTAFQEKVWREISRIPYGRTLSYSELAERAGAPQAVRAAGTSTGRNPVSIIVPCHRVVGKSGNLGGFAGGLETKRTLLALEDGATDSLHPPEEESGITPPKPPRTSRQKSLRP